MDSPFFMNRWNAPSNPRYYQPSPAVRPRGPDHTVSARSPKVVSIPVRFVDSSEPDRSGSALKIQKVFRGFLVRRCLKKILAIKREVDEIGKRISDPEMAEMVRKEQRERLRVNETLMNLLLRLDSVRGVNSDVRDCRKAVIRRVVALQEKVDAIVTVDGAAETVAQAAENGRVADNGSGFTEGGKEVEIGGIAVETERVGDADQEKHLEEREGDEVNERSAGGIRKIEEADTVDPEFDTHEIRDSEDVAELNSEFFANEEEDLEPRCAEDAMLSTSECSMETRPESQTDSSNNPESLVEGVDENAPPKDDDAVEEKHESDKDQNGGEDARSTGNKELLEKMVEDNEKMMGLMAELFQRNERQTRMLATLSQRVEQLERAFVCEKLRRKKRRQAAGCAADCTGAAAPEAKKCGKK